jgi:Asp-tRNA(Asn)/Glu-tRNA(Gln) amidotransferase A subunit family amidase
LIGALHGVPISLKDQFNVKGLDSTLGYVGRAFSPATSDALLVDVLRQLGAIIIAKTNLPQSIMVGRSNYTLPVFVGSLTSTVVRDREPRLGLDDSSTEPELHSRW